MPLVCCLVAKVFATSWAVIHQAPLPMGFSRQESWSGLPFPPLGDLPARGVKSESLATFPALQADSLLLRHWGGGWEKQEQEEKEM